MRKFNKSSEKRQFSFRQTIFQNKRKECESNELNSIVFTSKEEIYSPRIFVFNTVLTGVSRSELTPWGRNRPKPLTISGTGSQPESTRCKTNS